MIFRISIRLIFVQNNFLINLSAAVSPRFRKEQRIILFTNYHNFFSINGFSIRLGFSLASNHCSDLAHDYPTASVSHHEYDFIYVLKLDSYRFELSFSNFFTSLITPECLNSSENSSHSRYVQLCLSIHLCSKRISIYLEPRSQHSRFQI